MLGMCDNTFGPEIMRIPGDASSNLKQKQKLLQKDISNIEVPVGDGQFTIVAKLVNDNRSKMAVRPT